MPKMLSINDFDFGAIGPTFELDEVTPKFATETRTDENGQVILDRENKPRNFYTDEIIGYKYSVTILEGQFRKKATQVTINTLDHPIDNDEIMKRESVKCRFENLQPSMAGHPMYYKADKIVLLGNQK